MERFAKAWNGSHRNAELCNLFGWSGRSAVGIWLFKGWDGATRHSAKPGLAFRLREMWSVELRGSMVYEKSGCDGSVAVGTDHHKTPPAQIGTSGITSYDEEPSGVEPRSGKVPAAMDGGRLGPERKPYLRELIARFGYHLALNWNLGEENTQSPEEQRDMAKFIRYTDPYRHHIVVHSFPTGRIVFIPSSSASSILLLTTARYRRLAG